MQREFGYLKPLESAIYLDEAVILSFDSFRDAVIYCWNKRTRGKGLAEAADQALFCKYTNYTPSHFSRCVNPNTKSPMDLKADFIATFESYTGNRAVTQYCNKITQTTSLEQIQAMRKAA